MKLNVFLLLVTASGWKDESVMFLSGFYDSEDSNM